jgi:hypothetical protein
VVCFQGRLVAVHIARHNSWSAFSSTGALAPPPSRRIARRLFL